MLVKGIASGARTISLDAAYHKKLTEVLGDESLPEWRTAWQILEHMGVQDDSHGARLALGMQLNARGHCKVGVKLGGKKVWAWCVRPGMPQNLDNGYIRQCLRHQTEKVAG